jgi:hypothetical protein
MLTKLGTYLDVQRIGNRIDFQGQRSRSQGLIFRRGIRHALRCPCYTYFATDIIRDISPREYYYKKILYRKLTTKFCNSEMIYNLHKESRMVICI